MFISSRTSSSRKISSGFTLVELIIFIVIVSTAVLGILMVMNFTTANSADPQMRKQALSIAESLMEEVSLAQFTFCDPADPNAETADNTATCTIPEVMGPESGNVRPFDNVNDYNGLTLNPVTDSNGEALNLPGYSAAIQIVPAVLNGIATTEALQITVTVAYGNGQTIRLDGYRTRYAPNLLP